MIDAVAPLLLIIWIGFAAAGVRRVAAAESGLNTFVMWFALPAFLFAAIAGAPLEGGVPPWFLLVASVVPALGFAATWAIAAAVGAGHTPRATALTGAYGNVGYLGVPVVISVLGPEAGLAVGLGQLIHNLVFMVGYPVMAGVFGRGGEGSADRGLAGVLRSSLLLNPVALAVAAGVLAGIAPFEIPAVLAAVVDLLAAAAVPAALFAVGLALRPAVRGMRSGAVALLPLAVASAVKMLVVPGLTLGMLAVLGVGPGGIWAGTALLLAAMPTSATAYLLAGEYDDAGESGAAVVFVTSAAAVVILPAVALLVV